MLTRQNVKFEISEYSNMTLMEVLLKRMAPIFILILLNAKHPFMS